MDQTALVLSFLSKKALAANSFEHFYTSSIESSDIALKILIDQGFGHIPEFAANVFYQQTRGAEHCIQR
ncbi:hypothetical protein ACMXYX_17730 (plasmid) [Neptuniibacter sp. QD72_48]|uniref:hypothetical protein n=1 Tax=Neptuniibacter sp. QD72_48 TaxID=3398214 RepID=UPI0039F5D5FB